MFQSTLPRRGAIHQYHPNALICKSFNPRAPGGARWVSFVLFLYDCVFQSTRPRRGAMLGTVRDRIGTEVSIHAPPEGRD